jgi:hypothetical protein
MIAAIFRQQIPLKSCSIQSPRNRRRATMDTQVKRMIVDNRLIADAVWRMVCMAFCIGLAVSIAAAGLVLLVARIGA